MYAGNEPYFSASLFVRFSGYERNPRTPPSGAQRKWVREEEEAQRSERATALARL